MQLFTALAILTAAGLGFASPSGEIAPEKRFTSVKTTSSDLTLDKRFPGCIDSNGNDVACSCTVCRPLCPLFPPFPQNVDENQKGSILTIQCVL